jgi:hypothetical protein
MKDLVAEAVARTLSISSKGIAGWELSAAMEGRPGAPGMLRTRLQVRVMASREELGRLQSGARRGSWALEAIDADVHYSDLDAPVRLSVVLLYGKETQHIFKALAQMTVYRRNQKGKRK